MNVTSAVFVPNFAGLARPDVVVGVPIYLHGSQCVSELGPPCAGGTGFNPAAFTNPPVDPNTGLALRQGDLGRNALRGFGLWQWDFAVHRDFAIHDQLVLQFRSELFNVLNHPNYVTYIGAMSSSLFGEPVAAQPPRRMQLDVQFKF